MAKMHAGELDIDAALVRSLIAEQFARWADLPVRPVPSPGTDNAIFRLGDQLAVRLPRVAWAAEQPATERAWLPYLAPRLPLPVPAPVETGRPNAAYPWNWTICPWLPGDSVELHRLKDPIVAAKTLARFIAALHSIDAAGGPAPGAHNSGRGVPLAERDYLTRDAIGQAKDLVDAAAVLDAWEAALAARPWEQAPVWIHGDLQPGNVLEAAGEICAVIDFGCLGVGDPACDLAIAWSLLTPPSRAVFRDALNVDDAAWARARGWALSVSIVALPYYVHSNPALAGIARRTIDTVLVDEYS
jgi:aminoglycoside phosphotransferase (APT) family kinase protein